MLHEVKPGNDRIGPLAVLSLLNDSKASENWKFPLPLQFQEYPPGVKIVVALPKELVVFATHHHPDHVDDHWSLRSVTVCGFEEICIGSQRLRIISAPDHADGHMALLHVSTDSLIVGDHCVGQGSAVLDVTSGGNMMLVPWVRPTMSDAERRLLVNPLLDFCNERFILLSEACIPLFNFSTIYNYLMESNLSFLDCFDDPRPIGRGRYNKRMLPTITLSDWRKGSQWFEVNRKLALEIVSDTKFYPVFRNHCMPPCYMDEHYLPTLVKKSVLN